MDHTKICPRCEGEGHKGNEELCVPCGGRGYVPTADFEKAVAGNGSIFMTHNQWQDITTAPRFGWFLALRAPQYTGPTSCRVAVIHRVEGVGFGPWEGSEEAYYKADFFSHWMPFPDLPQP